MTLNKRINYEITELIEKGRITAAEHLCSVLKAKESKKSVSASGLPSYYFGDRNAKTVIINLNVSIRRSTY